MHRRSVLKTLVAAPAFGALQPGAGSGPWVGAEFWSNPLQDWRSHGDRMECHGAGGDRNVCWLTRELGAEGTDFLMSVRMGRLEEGTGSKGPGWAGFRIGVKSYFRDYRDAAVRGVGLNAGVTAEGVLFIGSPEAGPAIALTDFKLTLSMRGRTIELSSGAARVTKEAPREWDAWLTGGVALVCSSGPIPVSPPEIRESVSATDPKPGTQRGGDMRFWFRDWDLEGSKVIGNPRRAWGPILFNQYTLSRRVLKMTVQLAPLEGEMPVAELRGQGKLFASAKPDPFSATVQFRVPNWNDRADTPYTVAFGGHTLSGVIRRDPGDKPKIVVAALTCQNDFGFPHAEISRNLRHLNPDLLLFTGDQIYERNGEYGIRREPLSEARLDYLRKWYLFGWAWGDLTRNIPCVCLPDDHDVYQGNIWGAGGRKAEYPDGDKVNQMGGQDSGGYTMPAEWVKMVERTQSSHLPDGPRGHAEQDIGTHYSHLVVGGVSFALLEDRKFKSAPKTHLPEAKILNGWPQNPEWNSAERGDVPGARLLGDEQEKFLAEWAKDWNDGIWMKAVVSETLFVNLATLPREEMNDSGFPRLPILPPEEYAAGDKLAQDHDSNAWPQTPRTRALRLMRSGLAVHICGDQHLGSTVQYGIDGFDDGSFAICTPAISNLFPRRWFPPAEGANRPAGTPAYLGQHRDGFGNRFTVHAVANPRKSGKPPAPLHDRVCGFGVIEFEKQSLRVTLTNWPRWADLSRSDAKPYEGWPVTISALDNGLSKAAWRIDLPREAKGVAQVINKSTGEAIYTWRLPAPARSLPVWDEGEYSVRSASGEMKGLRARKA